MRTPTNEFKLALHSRRLQIGLWLGLASNIAAEICAGAGFDWLLIDCEHGPQDLPGVLGQLQAIAGYPGTSAVVRVPSADPIAIKQYLDIGAQSLLVPMVNMPAEAAAIVDACRYPPHGSRGIGGARAARWGRYPRYLDEADEQIAIIIQAETREAIDNLAAIAAVDGIDGVLIGPADLAASLGHRGGADHADVQAVIVRAFETITAAGKAAGILTRDESLARGQIKHGATFVAVGVDTLILAAQTSALAARFRQIAEE